LRRCVTRAGVLADLARRVYAAGEVPDFANLPAILRWEISLALLVLAWSLLSLGRYERLKRRWKRGRSPSPSRVVAGGEPARSVHALSSGRTMGPRPHRLKVLAAAAGFASLAASVAYAMPNIVHLDRPGPGETSAPEPEPQERRSPLPRGAVHEQVAPQSHPAAEERPQEPTRHPSPRENLTETLETEMVTSAATGASNTPQAPGPPASSPTPEPSVEPTPTSDETPTPTPSTPSDASPSPEPSQ
jgi:hypothetical protein